MTLVLPYCGDQIDKRFLFEPVGSMPCVYDGEPLDFEAALMSGEWPVLKDIATEYEQSDDTKATSGPNERSPKRKFAPDACNNDECAAKKTCSSSTPFSAEASPMVEEASSTDDQYPPRRRGPQMWNSRQRWKDERKKVLKMSVGKLAEIEDPELLLHKSVLLNNTIKKLHQDIRNERQAKIRHKQQKIDCFHHPERFGVQQSSTATSMPSPSSASESVYEAKKPDIYDDTSCDEIFGISEDFLRVNIPDRRMASSPIPQSNPVQLVDKESAMDVDPSADCDTNPAPIAFANRTQTVNGQQQARQLATSSGQSQCATQFRTNDGESSFSPRVPILDSVVYHSLLASLESS